jgi:hypothetical protein
MVASSSSSGIVDPFYVSLQEIPFLAATNVAVKNAKLLQKVFFAAKKMLLHVAAISAVAKSFAGTINVAAITCVCSNN